MLLRNSLLTMGPQAIVIHQKKNMSIRGTREYGQFGRIWKHLKTAPLSMPEEEHLDCAGCGGKTHPLWVEQFPRCVLEWKQGERTVQQPACTAQHLWLKRSYDQLLADKVMWPAASIPCHRNSPAMMDSPLNCEWDSVLLPYVAFHSNWKGI